MVKKIIALGFIVSFFSLAQARVMMIEEPNLERFKSKTTLEVSGIVTPKVLLFETDDYLGGFVALQDTVTNNFLPHRVIRSTEKGSALRPYFETSKTIEGAPASLNDNRMETAMTFDPENINHSFSFKNRNNRAITGFKIHLPAGSISPQKMTVEAKLDDNQWKPIIRNQSYRSYIVFPEITPSEVRVKLQAPNLLRINEIDVVTPDNNSHKTQIAFYASEGQSVFLWSEPEFGQKQIPVSRTSSLSLKTDPKTPVFAFGETRPNPIYNPDFDQDGIVDAKDLCPRISDPQNADIDRNGRGDVCEDPDQDGQMSHKDNCPFVSNRNQSDQDADGLGDACDDNENRVSEQSDIWMTASFMVMIFALLFLILRSALSQKKQS